MIGGDRENEEGVEDMTEKAGLEKEGEGSYTCLEYIGWVIVSFKVADSNPHCKPIEQITPEK